MDQIDDDLRGAKKENIEAGNGDGDCEIVTE